MGDDAERKAYVGQVRKACRVAQLLRELIANKVGIRSFAEKEPTLEDVFMLVTKGLVS